MTGKWRRLSLNHSPGIKKKSHGNTGHASLIHE